jgi:8-oxo-dGTP pyrophosphatase MutT (NUDIX family)
MPEINEEPIASRTDGSPIFDNVATVVCLLLLNGDGKLITVRRNNEPGKGKLGLPGGYHMKGESWQMAGARELFEETGYVIDPSYIGQEWMTATDAYDNNLIVGQFTGNDLAYDTSFKLPDEVQEVVLLDEVYNPLDWAFPLHFAAASEFMMRRQIILNQIF